MSDGERSPEAAEWGAPTGSAPLLCLPEHDLFSRRAARFRFLAADSHLGAYLDFLALLAEAQQEALTRLNPPPLPAPGEQGLCRGQGGGAD